MNIKGGAAGSVGFWGAHLMKEAANSPDPNVNDRVTVIEISGLLATNVPDALREMQAVASGSRSEGNFMYQANLNPQIFERLKPEQLREAVDILASELGFEGHQRVIVEHEKKGRLHGHVIFNRVDVDTMRVKDISGNFVAHERAAEKIEQKFGLERTPKPHLDFSREARMAAKSSPELWEERAAQRSGIDNDQLKAELSDLWRKTDSGKAFAAAVEERGYILAQGDRRNFCIVDQAGTAHSLARRIEGAKTKDVNERLADIDRDKLPTVEAARETQREKYPTKEAAREAWQNRTGAADHAKQQEPEKQPEQQTPEQKPKGKDWQDRDATKTEQKISGIQTAAERENASVAAGLYAEGLTLARVDKDGKADIEDEYVRRFENDKLKDIREGTRTARLRRTTFEEGELVAVTKWGEVHRLNPRFIDIEKLERAATGGSDKTLSLSEARENFATARQQQKDERTAAFETRQEGRGEERAYDRTANAFKAAPAQAANKFVEAGLKGLDGAGKIASLGSFVESLLGMGAARPPMTETQQQQRALEALENIEESIQRGDRLSPSDVANLLPTQLDNLKLHGNDYMLEIIKDLERDRKREQERGYGRELEQ